MISIYHQDQFYHYHTHTHNFFLCHAYFFKFSLLLPIALLARLNNVQCLNSILLCFQHFYYYYQIDLQLTMFFYKPNLTLRPLILCYLSRFILFLSFFPNTSCTFIVLPLIIFFSIMFVFLLHVYSILCLQINIFFKIKLNK